MRKPQIHKADESPGSREMDSHPTDCPPTDSTDLDLMKRLANGNESAMTELVACYGIGLSRLTGRLLSWHADHEDVFQEVLLTIWQKAASFRGTGNLEGWLKRVTVNHCRNHLKRQSSISRNWRNFFRLRQTVTAEAKYETAPTDALQRGLAQLNAQDRTVLVLFYLEEMSGNQVAETLGLRADHVHVRLNRARNKLKQAMNSEANRESE